MEFRNKIGKDVFEHKYMYREGGCGTWNELCEVLVDRVCSKHMIKADMAKLVDYMKQMKFMPGGRYLYYAGRKAKFFNNCFCLIAEDSREGWADLGYKHFMGLMCGGGIGTYYGKVRPKGRSISKTGGESSGPVPLMMAMNEIGRNVKQGGSRRSALYASLPWDHNDIDDFLKVKDWDNTTKDAKANNFNYPAPLDMTNISVCYDTKWLEGTDDDIFNRNVRQACETSEPGFAFNFYDDECDVARNAPVSGDTKVLTDKGYLPIKNTLGQIVTVWTGKQWAETEFKKTQENAKILNIKMTGGGLIKAEPSHPFVIEVPRHDEWGRCLINGFKKVPAKHLKVGDVLNSSLPSEMTVGGELIVKVVSVEQGKNEDVYCCDVKVPEHTFMAEGVIISNCTEVTSMFDSDVCNLGSLNMSRIDSIDEFKEVCDLANKFLICGTLEAELPYKQVESVRNMSRKIGLGLMGAHEWLIKRGFKYEFNDELHEWMKVYKNSSIEADKFVSSLGITPLVKYRAIAPTGTLSILAGTTGGIEPIFAKGTKRRYLKGLEWIEEIYPDPTVKYMVDNYDVDPSDIESSMDLSKDVEKRVKFQYDMQKYVDMAISSTVNLPSWGSEHNNEDTIKDISKIVRKYAKGLRGITFYADGSRGGQPLTEIPYEDAIKYEGINNEKQIAFMEETSCKSGSCGI